MNRATEISVAAVLLAAGRSSRMGENEHKLLAQFEGIPLVRRTVLAILSSSATSVTVVTGHRRLEIEDALSGLGVSLQENADYRSGMASSIVSGISHQNVAKADGVLLMPADMPAVTGSDLERMIAAFQVSHGRAIVRASHFGRPGNPVILPKSLHSEVLGLKGDVGARHIIGRSELAIIDLDIGEAACLDVDTTEEVIAAGGMLHGRIKTDAS